MDDNNYNPDSLQPIGIFFDLTIGDLNQIYVNPEKPVSMTMTMGETMDVTFTLYDVAREVEQSLWAAVSASPNNAPEVSFQFGYLQGAQSPVYNMDVTSFRPVFIDNSVMITIQATILQPMVSSNTTTGTVKEQLQAIAKNMGATCVFDPDIGDSQMQDVAYTEMDTTSSANLTSTSMINDSDQAKISKLLSWCRDSTGKGGYRCFIANKNGQKTMSITKGTPGTGNYQYTYQKDTSVVIAWKPELNFIVNIAGASNAQHKGVQRVTGDHTTVVLQRPLTDPFQNTQPSETVYPNVLPSPTPSAPASNMIYVGDPIPPEVTGASVRSKPMASMSPGAGLNPLLNESLNSQLQGIKATLVIQGDPAITPTGLSTSQASVDMTCYWPVNYNTNDGGQLRHYSSGTYIIEEVVQSIGPGSFTTTLSLLRAGMPDPGSN